MAVLSTGGGCWAILLAAGIAPAISAPGQSKAFVVTLFLTFVLILRLKVWMAVAVQLTIPFLSYCKKQCLERIATDTVGENAVRVHCIA